MLEQSNDEVEAIPETQEESQGSTTIKKLTLSYAQYCATIKCSGRKTFQSRWCSAYSKEKQAYRFKIWKATAYAIQQGLSRHLASDKFASWLCTFLDHYYALLHIFHNYTVYWFLYEFQRLYKSNM